MNKRPFASALIWPAIFIVVAAFGLYVRFYPLRANPWSENTEKATALVIAGIRMNIAQKIVAQFPEMPEPERNKLIEEQFAKTLHSESAMVKKTIREVSKNLGDETPEIKESIYLQEADGYYYYDLTQNIVNTGRLGGPVKGSKYLNEQMAAPFGFWQPINLHPYVGFLIYKIIHAFKPETSVMAALCWSGPILSLLALAAFLWCCRNLSLGLLSTAIGAFYFYLAPIFVKRSTFAWNDDDSYNLIFPLVIFSIVFKALSNIKNQKQGIQYGILASVFIAMYALFWHGWGYTFALLFLSGAMILPLHFLLDKKFLSVAPRKKDRTSTPSLRTLMVFFISITLGSLIGIGLLFGPGDFLKLFEEGFSGLQKLTVNGISLWPNLFVAVGELNPSSLQEIINKSANLFWWILTAAGLLWGCQDAVNRRDRARINCLIILAVTLLADLKLTLSAERFILLCLIPVALLGTIGLDLLVKTLRRTVHPTTLTPTQPKPVEWVAGTIFFIAAVFFPVRAINAQIPELLNPIFNSTWEKALVDIRDKTPKDSIVTSWWSPGHFIKAVADRRVTFDGATITKNVEAYWVANVFLTPDEREAAGILRMLNTGGIASINFLGSLGMRTSDAVSLLHFILPKTRTEAYEFLTRLMPRSQADKLIGMTHNTPPASYILLYSELMEKNIGLQFVGKWNFRKMEELNKDPQMLKELPRANSPEFFDFLWKTIGSPYRYSEAFISINESGGTLEFTQGIRVDLSTMQATVASSKYGTGTPVSIVYFNGNQVVEKEFSTPTLGYSIVLFKENTRYYCRLMDQELARSLLVKLYFFRGQGLEMFTPLSLQSSMTGRDEIFVFGLNREKL